VLNEIRAKYAQGIHEFCFYEDNMLMGRDNLMEILTRIVDDRGLRHIELHAPEGVEIRLLTPELLKLMKAAGFKKIYLPLETIHSDSNKRWNRDFYNIGNFERAIEMCRDAGFGDKPQQLNVFVLFGLPGEDLQNVYDTAVYASSRTDSIIPMLFAPVPGTEIYKEFKDYFDEQGFDFQHLNGKLIPMLEYNRRKMSHKYELTYGDYYDVENFMIRINQRVKRKPFRFNNDRVGRAFRNVYTSYRSVYDHNGGR
jgi:MoaA/NifB/PqqE/SkfB family radical SAM enzyme